MGLVIAVEAARTQLRLMLFDTAKLTPKLTPSGQVLRPQFEACKGGRWDLDDMVREAKLLDEISVRVKKFIQQFAPSREAEVQGIGIAVTGSGGLGNLVYMTYGETYVPVDFTNLFFGPPDDVSQRNAYTG